MRKGTSRMGGRSGLSPIRMTSMALMVAAGATMSARGDIIPALALAGLSLQPEKPISRPATPPDVPQPPVAQPADPSAQGNIPPKAPQPDAQAAQEIFDGPAIRVGKFIVQYRFPHPGVPPIEKLMNATAKLGETPEGYVKPREGIPTVNVRVADVADRPIENYRISGLEAITDAIRDELTRENIIGVVVRVLPDQVRIDVPDDDPEFGQDLRGGSTDVKIEVIVGIASQVRTLAFGDRVPYELRINNPIHQRIRDRSPVAPADSLDNPNRRDLIRRNEVDDFLYRLDRHPGRKVNVALSVGDDLKGPDGEQLPTVSLDYLVIENKPWFVYFQVSNTGTESTGEWRERFGFVHNQLTGRDDILSLDYVTSGFSESSNAFIGSYEARAFGSEKLRWRVFGSWNQFTADDVGQSNQTRDFEGDGWSAGGELIWNIFQRRELFIDLVGGAKWNHVRVEDTSTGGAEGEDDFFLPYIGLRLDRRTDTATTFGSVNFEFNWADVASTSDNLDELGRTGAESDWVAMQWDFSQSFYLEPLLIPSRWRDVKNGSPTLAHEVVLSFKGQYAFDNRIIPSFEQTVGGLYTVRGYRESAVAGDGIVVGSAEYRFHVPKAIKRGYRPGPDGKVQEPGTLLGRDFRWVPQQPYGSADWDLILKGFIDVGRTIISDVPGAEDEETLVGAGLGVEFQIRSNFSLRLDWGVALEDVESAEIKAGSNRVHFLATILF
ncbi:MAG: hypothetical protein AB7G11_13080 [Phycisphaerales bacterium]